MPEMKNQDCLAHDAFELCFAFSTPGFFWVGAWFFPWARWRRRLTLAMAASSLVVAWRYWTLLVRVWTNYLTLWNLRKRKNAEEAPGGREAVPAHPKQRLGREVVLSWSLRRAV